jgi:cytochrome o ubiquinol oxidase operon protein cyoD
MVATAAHAIQMRSSRRPNNTNKVLALAFGILIVFLVIAGSLWIMTNVSDNMMPVPELINLHMQH